MQYLSAIGSKIFSVLFAAYPELQSSLCAKKEDTLSLVKIDRIIPADIHGSSIARLKRNLGLLTINYSEPPGVGLMVRKSFNNRGRWEYLNVGLGKPVERVFISLGEELNQLSSGSLKACDDHYLKLTHEKKEPLEVCYRISEAEI